MFGTCKAIQSTVLLVGLFLPHFGAQETSKGSFPKFEEFPEPVYQGKPRRIIWPSYPDREAFVPYVTEHVRRGPNYAGHYVIIEWSCGTGCSSLSILNLKTGRFLTELPYGSLDLSTAFPKDDGISGVVFRANSRLLMASGCFDTDREEPVQCGTKYFVIANGKFKQIYYVSKPTPQRFVR